MPNEPTKPGMFQSWAGLAFAFFLGIGWWFVVILIAWGVVSYLER